MCNFGLFFGPWAKNCQLSVVKKLAGCQTCFLLVHWNKKRKQHKKETISRKKIQNFATISDFSWPFPIFFSSRFSNAFYVFMRTICWGKKDFLRQTSFFPTVSDLELSALRYKVLDRADKTFFEVSIWRMWAQFSCAVFEPWENFTWPFVDFFHRDSHNYILRVQSKFLKENIYLLKKMCLFCHFGTLSENFRHFVRKPPARSSKLRTRCM